MSGVVFVKMSRTAVLGRLAVSSGGGKPAPENTTLLPKVTLFPLVAIPNPGQASSPLEVSPGGGKPAPEDTPSSEVIGVEEEEPAAIAARVFSRPERLG